MVEKNYFNLYTTYILNDRKLYENIMKDPYSLKKKKIKIPEYYYEPDYAFPNLNYCVYKFGSKKDRMNRILKMYYVRDINPEKNWYRIIR